MTRDDVIRMAREAWGELAACMNEPQLMHFAALVEAAGRAAEREELAAIDWTSILWDGGLFTWSDAHELASRVVDAFHARNEA